MVSVISSVDRIRIEIGLLQALRHAVMVDVIMREQLSYLLEFRVLFSIVCRIVSLLMEQKYLDA